MALSWGCTHRRMSNMLPTSDVEWMNTNNENRAMYQKPESSQSSLHGPEYAIVALPFMHWQSVNCKQNVHTRRVIVNSAELVPSTYARSSLFYQIHSMYMHFSVMQRFLINIKKKKKML